jgi:DNA-directed RNA polymerase subunit beta'
MPKLILKQLEEYETLPVTSDKVIDKKRFHEEGLYSEKIFGPLKDYICSCGIYNPYGGQCKVCGVRYTKSDQRGKQFGHIDLPIEIINPLLSWNVSNRVKSVTKISISQLMHYQKFIIIKNNEPKMVAIEDFELIKNDYEHYTGCTAIIKVLDWLNEKLKEDPKFKVSEYIRPSVFKTFNEYRDHLIINKVLVVPPDLRPILFTGNKMIIQENLSRLYTTLLTKINIMSNKTKFIKGVGDLTFKNYSDIQYMVTKIYEEIIDVFGGKTGIIRANILGKRIDYSGRAVIAIDPSLNYNECKIPYYILLEVYKYSIAREISKSRNVMIFEVLEEIEESLKTRDYRFLDEVEKYTKDKLVILNRQPTLHKLGLLGWKIKVSTDFTIKIHPWCCEVYNADFDGDSYLGLVEVVSKEKIIKSNKEASNKLIVRMKDILNLEVDV